MTPAQAHRRDTYWLGYRHGQRIAAYDTQTQTELRLQLRFTDTREHRAFALGELRGYRQAKND